MSRLTLIPTPLGNLSDITPRATAALEAANIIAAEDTRRTGLLLRHLGISASKLVSYYKDVEHERTPELIRQLQSGQTIALVSDGGTPAISDPGSTLVAAARLAGIPVEVLPGPCAAIIGVAGTGFPGPFLFHGFLPRKAGEVKTLLTRLSTYPESLVFYASPHRVADDITALHQHLGNRPAWLARELTKMHEEWLGPDLQTISATIAARDEVKGECTLVVMGNTQPAAAPEVSDDEIKEQLASGKGTKEVAQWLAQTTDVSRTDAYARVLTLTPKR